jgi:hypothetical protein
MSTANMIRTDLSSNLLIWVEIEQLSSQLRCRCVVVGFCQHTDSTAQSNLQMCWLQLAMSEIDGQFEATSDVLRLLLDNATAFCLYRHAEEVLPRCGDQLTPLVKDVSMRQNG